MQSYAKTRSPPSVQAPAANDQAGWVEEEQSQGNQAALEAMGLFGKSKEGGAKDGQGLAAKLEDPRLQGLIAVLEADVTDALKKKKAAIYFFEDLKRPPDEEKKLAEMELDGRYQLYVHPVTGAILVRHQKDQAIFPADGKGVMFLSGARNDWQIFAEEVTNEVRMKTGFLKPSV
jgi:hypothetical protein